MSGNGINCTHILMFLKKCQELAKGDAGAAMESNKNQSSVRMSFAYPKIPLRSTDINLHLTMVRFEYLIMNCS